VPVPEPRPAALSIAPSSLLRAAAEAAGAQHYPPGLYMVATPIGNLADLTLRAVQVLALADAVACEDTRVSGELLRHLGLDKPLLALHRHNEAGAAARVLQRLAAGQRVAYVSDAGTPAISDPGARLVAAVRAAGHRVIPLPGPSSVATALSAAGDIDGQGFRFVGFVAPKAAARGHDLQRLADDPGTCVLFEAPHRIEAMLRALAAGLPAARRIVIARELTKRFETVSALGAGEIDAWLVANGERLRGEFVLVVAGDDAPRRPSALDARELLTELLAELPPARAVRVTARLTGEDREALYALAETLKAR